MTGFFDRGAKVVNADADQLRFWTERNNKPAHLVPKSDELLLWLSSDECLLYASVGGPDSELTPHEIFVEVTLSDIVTDVIESVQAYPTDSGSRGYAEAWRDELNEALARLDKALGKMPPIKE